MDQSAVGLRHDPIGPDAHPAVVLPCFAEREPVVVLFGLPPADARGGLLIESHSAPAPILERLPDVHATNAANGARSDEHLAPARSRDCRRTDRTHDLATRMVDGFPSSATANATLGIEAHAIRRVVDYVSRTVPKVNRDEAPSDPFGRVNRTQRHAAAWV